MGWRGPSLATETSGERFGARGAYLAQRRRTGSVVSLLPDTPDAAPVGLANEYREELVEWLNSRLHPFRDALGDGSNQGRQFLDLGAFADRSNLKS